MDAEKRTEIKMRLREKALSLLDFTRETEDLEVLAVVDRLIEDESAKLYISMRERQKLRRDVFNSLRRYDILQDLLEDSTITEIMVNGPNNIFVEKRGKIERFEGCFDSLRRLEDVAQQMAAVSNRRINQASPIVDTRLADGSRVCITLPPVALDGPSITIRKFSGEILSMQRLKEIGSITEEAAEFLRKLVLSGYNILISGGTGSGKTTFLNILSNYIHSDERIITIEDSAELNLQNMPNLVRLETRNAAGEGDKGISVRDLIKASLRMRPDRIIVGEVRGEEAIDMLQALNTGHDGALSSIHANSAEDVVSRLETMVLLGAELPLAAVRNQIASAVDIIVQLGRLRDKTRRVLEICEVGGCVDGRVEIRPLYSFVEQGEDENGRIVGTLEKVDNLQATDKLRRSGFATVSAECA